MTLKGWRDFLLEMLSDGQEHKVSEITDRADGLFDALKLTYVMRRFLAHSVCERQVRLTGVSLKITPYGMKVYHATM